MTTALFATTLFLSAGLMFWLELLMGRLLLPLLGGVPAVWTTCLAFYQAALLAGYAFVHSAGSRITPRRTALAFAALLTISLAFLPLSLRAGAPWPDRPLSWLVLALSFSVGAPVFILAAATPLLQQWYHSARPGEKTDPYFLYAASNMGSLLAVIGYPFLLEQLVGLARQKLAWSLGYGLFTVLALACAAAARKGLSSENRTPAAASGADASTRLRWITFAAIPSSLMMGATAYVSSEIAPIPLFWVVPLAIYLSTFVVAFAARTKSVPYWAARALPILVLPPALLIMIDASEPFPVVAGFHMLFLLAAGLCFHGELARTRPEPERLAEYYICIAVGGAIGGMFNAAVAPNLFTAPAEYPLTIALAAALRPPWPEKGTVRPAADAAFSVLLAAATAGAVWYAKKAGMHSSVLLFAPAAVISFLASGRQLRFGLSLGLLMLPSVYYLYKPGRLAHAERSFFGVHRILEDASTGIRWLIHGSTVHGGQYMDPARARMPLAYFHPSGPLPRVFSWLERRSPRARVAAIGLGAGSIARYGRAGQDWTFYEIDPAVTRIARDPDLFTFLSGSPINYRVVQGDGRRSIASAPDGGFDLLILDAFGSDAIPTHLLTREAFALYFSKLAPRRMALFHISNRFQDLAPVLGDLAADAGWSARTIYDDIANEADRGEKFPSTWVAMAAEPSDLEDLTENYGWKPCPRTDGGRVWSDDYADIAGILRWDRPARGTE